MASHLARSHSVLFIVYFSPSAHGGLHKPRPKPGHLRDTKRPGSPDCLNCLVLSTQQQLGIYCNANNMMPLKNRFCMSIDESPSSSAMIYAPPTKRAKLSSSLATSSSASAEKTLHNIHMLQLQLLQAKASNQAHYEAALLSKSQVDAHRNLALSSLVSASSATASSPSLIGVPMPMPTRCSSHEGDQTIAPVKTITPDNMTPRQIISQVLMRKNLSSIACAPPPPLPTSSASALSSSMLRGVVKTDPLDLLSSVSAHVSSKQYIATQQATASLQQLCTSERYLGPRNPSGQRHGKGIMKYSNGCRYIGTFSNDKRSGYGKCWYPNGCIYFGDWLDGQRCGEGTMLYVNGDVFVGCWKEDRRHGSGIYYYADGRADVCWYENHEVVGEGTRWSPSRTQVLRLVDGRVECVVGMRKGLEIIERMGLKGVPKINL